MIPAHWLADRASRKSAMAAVAKQDNQPVYVLHTYPFKETSRG